MVPNGWSAEQFGDLANFKSGGTPSKQNIGYWGGEEPWISGKDLKSHYLSTSIDKLSTEGFKIAKKAPLGSSLILVRGMTLLKDFPVGFVTREVAFNQDVKSLVAKPTVDSLFLSFLLVGNKHKIKNLVTTAGHGTGRLDTESLKEFPVNLPPLPEQRKIAQILIVWDKAILTTEKLIDASKQQKKALMQQLLTGKKRLIDPETGKAFEGEWEEVELKKVCSITKGKQLNRSTLSRSGSYPVINGGVTPSGYTESFNVDARNITISEGGNSCGYVAFQEKPFWCGGHCYRLSQVLLDTLFLYQYLKYSERRIMALRVGSGLPNIQKKAIECVRVLSPSIEEQQKIASLLTFADKEIELLQAKLTHLKQEKKALMQQLLTGKRRVCIEHKEEIKC